MKTPLLSLMAALGFVSALHAQTMVVESTTGLVTQNEVNAFKAYMQSQNPPPNGWTESTGAISYNTFCYGSGGGGADALGQMYEVTNDVEILNRMIDYAENMVAARNDLLPAAEGGQRVMWTGTIAKCWPPKAPDSASPTYAGSESCDTIQHIGYCALLILKNPALWNVTVPDGNPHGFGVTYKQRAVTYVTKCDEACDDFFIPWFVTSSHLLRWPTSPLWSLPMRGGNNPGQPVPYNQQAMFTGGFLRLAQCHDILADNPTRVASYDVIINASINEFLNNLTTYTKNGKTYYNWSYVLGSGGSENTAHGNYDILGLYRAYERGKYGISLATMGHFADTMTDIIYHADTDDFGGNVDGTYAVRSGVISPGNGVGAAWYDLNEFNATAYDINSRAAYNSGRLGTSYGMTSSLLWSKNKHYFKNGLFTTYAAPATRSIAIGANTTFTVNFNTAASYTGTVALAVSGLPANTTANFSPSSLSAAGTSTLTVTTTGSTAAGIYTLTISGTQGSTVTSAPVTLRVGLDGAVVAWSGTTTGDMAGTPTNWVGGSDPTGTQVASWNASSYTNVPSANADMTLGELLFDSGNTISTLTFGLGTGTLTLNGFSGMGVQMLSGSGNVNTGSAKFALAGTQSWVNNTLGKILTVGGTITNSANTAPVNLTIDGASATTLNGIISNGGSTGTLGLTKSGGGTLTLGGVGNTFTGGLVIKAGTVYGGNNAATFGAGSITLGDATEDHDAILKSASNITRSNAIIIGGGVSDRVFLTTNSSGTSIFSGGVTGTGDVTLNVTAAGALKFSTVAFNHTGSITNVGVGTGTATIALGVGSNVQSIIQNSATSPLILSGTNTHSGDTTVTAGTLSLAAGCSLPATSTVSIDAGATFDVSALGASATYTLGSSASLAASGNGTTAGVDAAVIIGGATGTVSLGTRPVLLAITPTSVAGDTTHPALVVAQGALTLSGNTITINNTSTSPLGMGTYRLIQVTGGTINGTPNTTPVITGTGLVTGSTAVVAVSGGYVNLIVTTPVPTVTVTPSGTTSGTSPIVYTMTFSTPVTGLAAGEISVTNGSKGTLSGSGSTYTIPVTPSGQGAVTCQVYAGAAQDQWGTSNAVSNTASVTYDSVAPTVAVTPSGTVTGSSPISFTLTFSEAVTGLTAADIVATNGTVGTITGSGTTYTVPVTPSAQGVVTCKAIAAAAQDAAGNNNTISNIASVTYDSVGPLVTISDASAYSTMNGPVTYTVTYADANFNSSTLAAGNITLNTTGTATGSVAVTGSGTTRTVTISSITGNGTLGISLAAGTASDTVGNQAAAAGPSMTFIVNSTGPITKATTGTDLTASASWTGGVAPTSTDVAGWSGTSLGASLTLATSKSWAGINVTSAASAIAISGAGTLTLGSGGMDLSASTVNLTISNPLTLGANQSWNVNSARTLTTSGIISGSGVGLTKTGSGSLALSGANTFSGGLTIKQGTVTATTSASALGGSTGAVTLGGLAGQDAKLMGNTATYTLNNPITLSSTGGTLTIGNLYNSTLTYGGTVSGTHDLVTSNNNNGTTTFTNVAITGAVTNSGTGVGAVVITTLGSNVGSLTETATSPLTITNYVAASGNLLLTNNGTAAITLTGGARNSGSITNVGTGTGGTTITGAITNVVSSVTQSNPNSTLKLASSTNAFTGGLYIKAGIVYDNGTVGALGPVSSTIYLGDTSGSANATLQTNLNATATNNPIVVQAGSSGNTLSIENTGGQNATLPGSVTLGHDLTLKGYSGTGANRKTLKLTGNITGTGNITLVNNQTLAQSSTQVELSGSSINFTGTITNTGTGLAANTNTISGNIGSNVTGVTQNSTTTLILSGTNTYTGPTTVSAGILSITKANLAASSTVNIATGAVMNLNFTGTNNIAGLVIGGTNVPAGVYSSAHPTYGSSFTGAGSLTVVAPPTVAVTPTGTLTGGSPITFTLTFSSAVTGLTAAGITVTNGSKGTLAGSGTTYTIPVTPSAQGTVTCQVNAAAAQDSGGRNNIVSNNASVTYDSIVPTVAVTSTGSLSSTSPITFTLTFSKPVTGLTTAGVAVSNCTAGTLSGSGTTYTLPVTPSAQGVVTCQVNAAAAHDTAGNNNTGSNTSLVTYDSLAPVVTIGAPSSTYPTGGSVTFLVSYADANFSASTLTAGDITLNTTGTATGTVAVTGSGTTRTVTISSITGTGALGISLAANTASDTLGNLAAAAGPSATCFVNNSPPIIKAATGTDLTAGASWTGGTAPGAMGVAGWTSTSLGAGLTLATSSAWGGINVTGALTNIAITGAGTLTLDGAGMDLSTSTVNLTISNPLTLSANQTWNVNTAKTLTASGIIGGSGVALTKLGGGTAALTGANTFTGGLAIKSGTVSGNNASSFGAGTITLGDSADSAAAGLLINGAVTYNNTPLVVATGNTGVATITTAQTLTFPGTITLADHDLTVGSSGSTGNLTGGITGTGDLTLANTGSGTLNITTGSVNHAGSITNSGTGTGGVTISAVIGDNVSTVTQSSATSKLTMSSTNAFDALYILAGTVYDGAPNNSLPLPYFGTGTIYLGDTSGSANATLQTGLNTTGYNNPIIVRGGSTGVLTIASAANNNSNATLPGNVTLNHDLVLDDPTPYNKSLTLTGNISGTGDLYITESGNYVNASPQAGGSVKLTGASINHTGAIINNGTGTSIKPTIISGNIGPNVTAVIQNSATSALTLTGVNTYTGPTTVSAGTLSISSAYLADTSTVTIAAGAVMNLNFTGSDTIATLVLGGTTVPGGTYSASDPTYGAYFTGTGSLTVVPPPSVAVTPTGTLTGSSPITFTLTFSSPVTGLTAAGITVTNGSKGTLAGSGTTYTIPVTPSAQGSVTCQVNAAAAHDSGGRQNTVSNNAAVTYDSIAPTVTVTPSGTLTASSPITFTLTFSESVSGLTSAGITVTNGSKGTLSGSGTTYTLPVTPSGQGAVTCQVTAAAAHDAANNNNSASNNATVTYDSLGPVVTIGAPSVSSTTSGPVTYSVTYADANFSASTLTTGNITLNTTGTATGTVALSGSGTSYTVTISSITGNGTLGISLAAATASDTLGNTAAAAGPSATFLVNNSSPAVKASTGSDLTAGASWTGGSTPLASQVASWTSTSLGGNLTLATSSSWGGISVTGASTNISISGAGTLTLDAGGMDLSSSTVNLTISNPLTLAASQTWNVNTAKTITASGIISGSGVALTKSGAGTLTLSGANTFSGGLAINQGTVTATTSTSALGGSGTGTVTLGGVAGQDAKLMGNTTTYTLSNPITLSSTGGTLTIGNSANGALTYAGTVSGTHDLVTSNNNNNTTTFTNIAITGGVTNSGTGAGGVVITTLGSNVGSLTETSASALTITNSVTTGGNLLLTNNGTAAITLTGGASNSGSITNAGTGTGGTTITGAITNAVSSVTQSNPNSTLKLSNAANAFTGGLYIKAGMVYDNGTVGALGPVGSTIYLGDTSGSANATLQTGLNATATNNPIVVQAGSTGTLTIQQIPSSNSNGTLPGSITLNNNLTLKDESTYTKTLTLSGSISGTGNITIASASGASKVTLSGSSINPTGTITNSGATTGTTTISGVIGSNVTEVIQNSSTSALTLSGANTYTGNTTVSAGTLSITSAFLADSSTVTIATGAVLNLNFTGSDTIATLVLGGTTVPDGTYDSTNSTYGAYFTGAGSLTVSSGGRRMIGLPSGGATTYALWSSAVGVGFTDTDPSHDPDGDGVNNLLEYALGGQPMVASQAPLPQCNTTSGKLALTFIRSVATTDITLVVQAADSLDGPWTDIASSVNGTVMAALLDGVEVVETGTGTSRAVEVRDLYLLGDANHPRRFLRLQVQHTIPAPL